MLEHRPKFCFLLFTLMLVWGCSLPGSRTDRNAELLGQDYATMSDKELLTYYYQLSDQLAKTQRKTAAGKETGRAGSSREGEVASGAVSRRTVEEDLRDRWNDVRRELRRRGLRQ